MQENLDIQIPGFEVLKLHFSVDPEAKKKALAQKSQMAKEDWEREHNLRAIGNVTSYPVFSGWRRELHEDDSLVYQPSWGVIFRGWDFGRVRPAVEFFQSNGNLVNGVDEITDENTDLEDFTEKVLNHCSRRYPRATFIDRCDPSGRNAKDTGKSSVEVLKDFGLRPRWKIYKDGDFEKSILIVTRMIMKLDPSGRPRLQINPKRMPKLAAAMRGGYRRNRKGEPVKDGDHDHHTDALRFAVLGMSGSVIREPGSHMSIHTRKALSYRYEPRNSITGY